MTRLEKRLRRMKAGVGESCRLPGPESPVQDDPAPKRPWPEVSSGELVFSPKAWLKLNWMCHSSDVEVAGFGISPAGVPGYVEDFETVRQESGPAHFILDDPAYNEWVMAKVEAGMPHERFHRIWLHTHPGESANPSGTDEETFARVFGKCDWSVMFILGKTGKTYARQQFGVGLGGRLHLPVRVDWAALPAFLAGGGGSLWPRWNEELAANVTVEYGWPPEPAVTSLFSRADDADRGWGFPQDHLSWLRGKTRDEHDDDFGRWSAAGVE